MAWPPKIAHAKPHERPKPFDQWYFTAEAKGHPAAVHGFPLATELLKQVCGNDEKKFERANEMLEEAFNAGVEYAKRTK